MSRGDVHRWNDDGKGRGHEQKGDRRCVIVSSYAGSASGRRIVCKTSANPPSNYTEDLHPKIKYSRTRGTPKETSYVLCEQIMTADDSRIGAYLGTVDDMELVDTALKLALGLDGSL